MWQEERGKPYYRFQTDDKLIHQKMKRREKFNLVGEGVNCNLWIYQAEISRPDIARKILKSLSGAQVNFDSKADIFYSEGISIGLENSAA
jgi:hypothetical protein